MFDLEEWLKNWILKNWSFLNSEAVDCTVNKTLYDGGQCDIPESGRQVFVGRFVDDNSQGVTATKFVINSTSGTIASADVRYSRFRISAVSYKNKGLVNDKALKQVENDINLLLDHIQSTRIFPCGYGNIRAVTTIQGPTFTADNRVVYSLDIELLK